MTSWGGGEGVRLVLGMGMEDGGFFDNGAFWLVFGEEGVGGRGYVDVWKEGEMSHGWMKSGVEY